MVIPEGVRPPTLVIDTRWPDDTIFDITNNDPNDIPVINPATYPEYTINRVGDNWGGSGTILYLYISANVDNSGNDVLAYANSTVYPLADVYNQVYTWIIVVTGNIDGLTLQNFPVGCSAIIINQATISQAYDIGNEGHGGSGGTSNFGAIRAASVNGFAGADAITIDDGLSVAIDNGDGNIWGGGGGGGGGGNILSMGVMAFAGGGGGQHSLNYRTTNPLADTYASAGSMVGGDTFYHKAIISNGATYKYSEGESFTFGAVTETITDEADSPTVAGTGTLITGSGAGSCSIQGGTGGAGGGYGEVGSPGTAAVLINAGGNTITTSTPGNGGAAGKAINLLNGASVVINSGDNSSQIKGAVS